ncbi:hypothetical protein BKP45_03330 [Anaerobacillus alkalidiazotrophicus]|uniref:Bacterial repeat domain-containing protein n=1 Tax=Anaerobacillus alkalidiazotrophicus TaxID=472963 RepID=A0A1S2MB59_9BACI|nr:tetratricopeptide repeat protein [Anaerobacillus alkalidiazotrophicus]OIJ21743.1 hypothetical protein BKP45_03330 [Anaerobacillus alkalidiazotrophicus]
MERRKKRIVLAALLLLLFLGLGSYFTVKVVQSGTITEQLDLGNKFYSEGDYEEAIIAFEKVLDIDPRHTDARIGLAKSLVALDRTPEAERVIHEGISIKPKEPKFYSFLADLYISEGRIEEAIAVLDDGIDSTNDQSLVSQRNELDSNIKLVAERTIIQIGYDTIVQLVHVDEEDNETILKASEWSLNPDDIATISEGLGNQMVVEGIEIGVTEVTAKLHSIERAIEIEVSEQALATIEFQLKADTIAVGDTVEIVAIGYDFDGNEMEIDPEWLYEANLGSLSQQAGTSNAFVASEDGTVEIHVIDGEVTSILSFTVEKKKHTLNTSVVGSGQIVRKPNASEYEDGSTITLEAVASSGWEFVRWEGALTGSQKEQELMMDEEKTVRAIFEEVEVPTYRLATEVTGEGTIRRSSNTSDYQSGQRVTLTAEPRSGWEFVRWEIDLTGTTTQRDITMTSNKAVRAVFREQEQPVKTYRLTTTVQGEGTIQRSSQKERYNEGETVTLTAHPKQGYEFVRWEGDVTGTNRQRQVTINSDKTVRAVFKEKEQPVVTYRLTTTVNGEGTIQRSSQKDRYNEGETVTLTAHPKQGYEFVRWEGDVTGTNPQRQVTMNSNKTVNAVFKEKVTYTLTTTVDGEGVITRSTTKSAYPYGEEVTLTAQAEEGWAFVRWTGDATGTNPQIKVTMTSDKSVKAVFEEVTTYTLTTEASGDGYIIYVSDNDKERYLPGEEVTLKAMVNSGSMFEKWSKTEDGNEEVSFSYENELHLVMDNNIHVKASFRPYGSLQGAVTDSTTGTRLSGVTVEATEVHSGRVFTTTTDDQGNYYIPEIFASSDENDENVMITFTSEDYLEETRQVTIQAGETTTTNVSVMPIREDYEDEIRIVLDWGAAPRDLDAHLYGPTPTDANFHVFYGNRSYSYGEETYVSLDVDVTNGHGPETITIYQQIEGEYVYRVHQFSSDEELKNSSARVRVYRGNQLVETFRVPTDLVGREWYVFKIIGNDIIPMENDTESSEETTSGEDSDQTEVAASSTEASTATTTTEAVDTTEEVTETSETTTDSSTETEEGSTEDTNPVEPTQEEPVAVMEEEEVEETEEQLEETEEETEEVVEENQRDEEARLEEEEETDS